MPSLTWILALALTEQGRRAGSSFAVGAGAARGELRGRGCSGGGSGAQRGRSRRPARRRSAARAAAATDRAAWRPSRSCRSPPAPSLLSPPSLLQAVDKAAGRGSSRGAGGGLRGGGAHGDGSRPFAFFLGFFDPCHYNLLTSEICHYNSPILKPAITIFRFFESCHFIRFLCLWTHLQTPVFSYSPKYPCCFSLYTH